MYKAISGKLGSLPAFPLACASVLGDERSVRETRAGAGVSIRRQGAPGGGSGLSAQAFYQPLQLKATVRPRALGVCCCPLGHLCPQTPCHPDLPEYLPITLLLGAPLRDPYDVWFSSFPLQRLLLCTGWEDTGCAESHFVPKLYLCPELPFFSGGELLPSVVSQAQ